MEIAKAVFGKKAEDITLLYVGEISTFTDYYLICSADSEPQIWAVVDAVETALQKNKLKPLGIEGRRTAPWVLVDCSDIVVHIFKKESRAFYNLDELYANAERIDLSEIVLSAPPKKVRKRKASS